MKVYKGNKVMNADKEQMDIVLDAGWSKTKPESKKAAKVTTEDESSEVKPAPAKLKKIRKATPKKD